MPTPSSYLGTNKKDIGLMAAAVTSLVLATIIVSPKRPLWYDEIYSWTLVTDPSFRHMIYALRMAAESPPGMYHVLARMWLAITGPSTLALRLFATTADSVALVVTWTTLRRVFSLRATALGVLTVFCTSGIMLDHSAEARYYPLFVACAALAIAAYARTIESDRLSPRLALAIILSNLALVQAHIYGVAYSAALLFALICCDIVTRRLRPLVYACIAATWLSLIPLLPVLHRVNEQTKPRHWIEAPTFATVIEFYRLYSTELPVILLAVMVLCLLGRAQKAHEAGVSGARNMALLCSVCLLVGAVLLWTDAGLPHAIILSVLIPFTAREVGEDATRDHFRQESESDSRVHRLRHGLLALALVLLAAPPLAAGFSWMVRPVFVPKYVLPSFLGMAVLLAWLVEKGCSRVWLPTARRNAWLTAGWSILLFALLAMPLWSARREDVKQPPKYGIANAAVEQLVPKGTPIAVESFHLFLPLRQAASQDVSYSYIGDQNAASDPGADRSALLHYRASQLWKALGYLGADVAEPDEFVAAHPVFAVVHSPKHLWFEWRIRNNPEYTWRSLGKIDKHEVLLVVRKSKSSLTPARVGDGPEVGMIGRSN